MKSVHAGSQKSCAKVRSSIRAPNLCKVAAVTLSAAKRDSLPVNNNATVPESEGAKMPENTSLRVMLCQPPGAS
jgi:hypothetical protein